MTRHREINFDQALWRVVNYGRQHIRSNDHYWWDNRGRKPDRHCVVQIMDAGDMQYRVYQSKRQYTDQLIKAGHALVFFFNDQTAYGFPSQPHNEMKHRWLTLEGAGLWEQLCSMTEQYSPILHAPPGSRIHQSFNDAYQAARRRKPVDDFQETQCVYQLVLDILREGAQRGAQALPPVEQAIQSMLRHPTSDWSLGEIADRHSVSREHLTRVFTKKIGTTPARYLNEKRVQRALQLLYDTSLSVKQIAEQSGFTTARTLTRQIKQTTGLTPQSCREQQRRD